MSYIYVGVGGSGSKLLQTLIHLSAAGLMPQSHRELLALLVDSDQDNGNLKRSQTVRDMYSGCQGLQYGDQVPIFKNPVRVMGPWTPVKDLRESTLGMYFDYGELRSAKATVEQAQEADLIDLLFENGERDMKIFEGFRARPAVGSVIFSKEVEFEYVAQQEDQSDAWREFKKNVLRGAQTQESVPLVLAGSVFGGSGAAGVPTFGQLISEEFQNTKKLQLGLILFLPYFTFTPDPSKGVQADPHSFPTATVEALKYYDEQRFLDICRSIYAVGDVHLTEMPTFAVGSEAQNNPPHYVELVAGLGALRYFDGVGGRVLLAARDSDRTVRWSDLPAAETQLRRLQQFTLFAVVFHFLLYPEIAGRVRKKHALSDHLEGLNADEQKKAGEQLGAVDSYLTTYLEWMLSISTPVQAGVSGPDPGMVEPEVFAIRDKASEGGDGNHMAQSQWRLKRSKPPEGKGSNPDEFREKDIDRLFKNLDHAKMPSIRSIFNDYATYGRGLKSSAGKVVEAAYEACKFK